MAISILSRQESQPVSIPADKLLDFLPDAILVASSEGRICEMNPQTERLFGYSRSELIGQPIEVLVPERFRGVHTQHRAKYHQEPRMRPMGADLELWGRRKDGSEFPVDILLSPIRTDEGAFVLAVVRDVTERKQIAEALRLSEERFRMLVESARDYAIFMLDPAGKVATWNPGAQRIKGYAAEEILGQHFSKVYMQEDIDRGKPKRELEIARTEGRCEDEGWRIRKDGSRFWANVVITALHGLDGRLIGFSKVTRDFSNRKTAEEALLLELSNAVLAGLDIHKMFTAIAAG